MTITIEIKNIKWPKVTANDIAIWKYVAPPHFRNWNMGGILDPVRQATKKQRKEVLKRDNYRCRYCGTSVTYEKAHIDHVTPWIRTGITRIPNLVTSCRFCNLKKSADISILPSPRHGPYKNPFGNPLCNISKWENNKPLTRKEARIARTKAKKKAKRIARRNKIEILPVDKKLLPKEAKLTDDKFDIVFYQ
ncbi:HNH endonuclease [Candidatus Woesearchaeota archaeon]|nr:HNH endonuclease [Candidatus Woesearchaeota archaeon]